MGIFDWKHWAVILIVVVLVFGTKKMKNLGSDLGESIKGFRKAMNDEEAKTEDTPKPYHLANTVTSTSTPAEGMQRADNKKDA
ncbi:MULTISPECIES: twin-arginine translocase TatA/TatE family subunit [Pseudomonas syringae group]|nr:twin-arginine translocase TatA/TatE family subunit [Pseudomonas viridiflava]